jgi:hypothetical protein
MRRRARTRSDPQAWLIEPLRADVVRRLTCGSGVCVVVAGVTDERCC